MVLDALPPSLPETSISVVSLPSVCDEGVRINLIYLLIPAILFGCLITTRLCEYIPQPSPYTLYSIPHTHIFPLILLTNLSSQTLQKSRPHYTHRINRPRGSLRHTRPRRAEVRRSACRRRRAHGTRVRRGPRTKRRALGTRGQVCWRGRTCRCDHR